MNRIEILLKEKNINPNQLAKLLGKDRTQGIYDVIKGKANISRRFANEIICVYPDVSLDWLMNGTGEMIVENIAKEQIPLYANPKQETEGIPLIPFDAMAGWLSVDNPGVNVSECEQYNVPEFANKGADYIIRVSGSSMYPKYSNGDLLACKKITDILFFQWGKVYVLDTSQGVLVKRVYEDEKTEEKIVLLSDNKEHYPAFSIPKSDIRSLSIVLGVIRME